MNRASRESIFAALFAQLQTIPSLQTCSRTTQQIESMQPEALPAGFQMQGKQTTVYRGDVPTRAELTATWALYGLSNDPDVPSSSVLNDLVDAACAAIAPQGPLKQTLGGLVEYAAIDGDIEIYEGLLGNRAVALVPIKLILGGF